MKTSNKELMASALLSLKGKWRISIKVVVIYFIINLLVGVIPIFGFIARIIIAGPFTLGLAVFWLNLSRNQEVKFEQMFEGFHTWWRACVAYLLLGIFILLWMILLIIPGIIAAYAYSQTFFILAEDKNIKARDAIRKSKEMMRGYKWKLFCLQLRFLGWALLCILTLGIGFLWLAPYMQVTMAKFYDDIKPEVVSAV